MFTLAVMQTATTHGTECGEVPRLYLESFINLVWTYCLPQDPTSGTQEPLTSFDPLPSTLSGMRLSAAVIASVLSLLSCTCALPVRARDNLPCDCPPDTYCPAVEYC